MNTHRLGKYSLLFLALILSFAFGCNQQPTSTGDKSDVGQKQDKDHMTTTDSGKGPPRHDPYDEAIGIYTYIENGNRKAKANPPVKHIDGGKQISFVTDGCNLDFTPSTGEAPNSKDLFPKDPVQISNTSQWIVTVGTKPGAYKYTAHCGGTLIEGNSPPVIIIDP